MLVNGFLYGGLYAFRAGLHVVVPALYILLHLYVFLCLHLKLFKLDVVLLERLSLLVLDIVLFVLLGRLLLVNVLLHEPLCQQQRSD